MSDSEKNELVNSFKSLAGVDDERATFFLESAKWDLSLALAAYYDQEDESAEPERPRVADLGSLNRRGEEEESSDEEGQAFFAGGSETSGQQILGPSKKKKGDNVIENIFKSARDHGAEEVRMEEAQRLKRAGGRPQQVFRGSGYRLGESSEEPVEKIAGEAPAQPPMTVDLTFWENGFSVDDGPLRDFSDPNNKPFIEAVQTGRIPPELLKLSKGGEVHVNMIDKRGEEYVRPKPKRRAFGGEGHMLGSPTPAMNTASAPAARSQPAAEAPTVKIDESQPVTQIQIRLANGSRLVSKFNSSHTVKDVRSHILATHPEYADRTFVLMTTFPNKELTDDAQTIDDAKLHNAVIVQRLK